MSVYAKKHQEEPRYIYASTDGDLSICIKTDVKNYERVSDWLIQAIQLKAEQEASAKLKAELQAAKRSINQHKADADYWMAAYMAEKLNQPFADNIFSKRRVFSFFLLKLIRTQVIYRIAIWHLALPKLLCLFFAIAKWSRGRRNSLSGCPSKLNLNIAHHQKLFNEIIGGGSHYSSSQCL